MDEQAVPEHVGCDWPPFVVPRRPRDQEFVDFGLKFELQESHRPGRARTDSQVEKMADALEKHAAAGEQFGGGDVECKYGYLRDGEVVEPDVWIPEVVLRLRLPDENGE